MVILFGGGIYSGKDTAASILMHLISNTKVIDDLNDKEIGSLLENHEFLYSEAKKNGWDINRFAELPKRQTAEILGLSWDSFNSHDNPNKKRYREYYANHAETLKTVYGEKVWANSLFQKYRESDNWIICDWRYPCELESLIEKNIEYRAFIIERHMSFNDWFNVLGIDSCGILIESEDVFDRKSFLKLIEKHPKLNENTSNKQIISRITFEEERLKEIFDIYPENVLKIKNTTLKQFYFDIKQLIFDFI